MIRDGNNNENMKGTVSDADLSSITIKMTNGKLEQFFSMKPNLQSQKPP